MRQSTWVVSAVVLATVAAEATPVYAQSKPAVTRYPANSGNYTNRASRKIDRIVIHDMEGTAPGAVSWFANPASKASAHYCVHYDGRIWQCVDDNDIAWHAGNWSINERSIGIEHSGFAARNLYTQAEYEASAKLVAYLCKHYGIPIDRQHIIAHAEVPDPNHPGKFGGSSHHTDPGPHWDWNGYMALVRKYAGATPTPPPPPAVPDYQATAGAQSHASVTLKAGDTAIVWFELKNTGGKTWVPGAGSNLGTQKPQDRSSPLVTSGNWLGANRPTAVDKTTPPGAVGRYTFILTAPAVTARTTYHEVYRAVQDGVTWFGPEVAIDVTVEPKPAPTPTPTPTPTPAPTPTPTPTPAPGPPPQPPPTAGKAKLRVLADPLDAVVWVSASDDSPGVRLGLASNASGPVTFELGSGRWVVTALRAPYGARSAVVTAASGKTVDVALDLRRPLTSTLGAGKAVAGVTVSGGATPVVLDLDGDGKLDLIVGADDGSVTLFRGTGAGLAVAAGAPLKAAGAVVKASPGPASPSAADWDGDGAVDLLLGQGDGSVVILRGDGKGGFLAASPLQAAAVPGAAAPFAADLDDDGLLDLVVGQADGTVRFHRRLAQGTLDQGRLLAEASGAPLAVPGPARAVARDLRQVGRLDLVVGGTGEVRVFESAGPLAFTDAGPLATWTAGQATPLAGAGALAPALADVDGDGRLDLVLGDGAGLRAFVASGVTGDVDDSRKVDARDLIRVQRAIGAKRGEARFDPAADLDEDGVVDKKDTASVLKQLGAMPR